jgi:regulator of RNase E activity RraB
MQEYWELYMKNLEGHPSSVLFNAGISMDVEELQQTHPTVAFIKVTLKEPNENGLLSESEESEILFMEDKLEASMLKFRIGKYVGRIISNSTVTFIFYMQFTYNWQDFLDFALSDFSHYSITNGHSEDREWNYYKNLLYPTAKEWQIIQNHKVCQSLTENGDDLEIKRAIEHKAYFIDESKKVSIIKELESDGFVIQEDITNEDGVKGVSFYRLDKPHYYHIDELTINLIEKLEKLDASYDGWETSIVKS